MEIRLGRPDDFEDLTGIWFRAVSATHAFLGEAQIEAYRVRLPVEFLPHVKELWVAEEDGRSIGFIGMDGSEIDMLFVDPDWHGRGVGTRLLEMVSEDRPRLTVSCNEQNPQGLAFYEARGFRPVGRSGPDTDGNAFPLIHFERG